VPVFIRADGTATHQSFVTVLDVVGQLGFRPYQHRDVTPPDVLRPAGVGQRRRLTERQSAHVGSQFAIRRRCPPGCSRYLRPHWPLIAAAIVPASIYAAIKQLCAAPERGHQTARGPDACGARRLVGAACARGVVPDSQRDGLPPIYGLAWSAAL